MAKKLTRKQFIKKARKIHSWKYDYSKVIYINSYTYVIIICPTHGDFLQRPDAHLYGQGCSSCMYDNNKLTKEEFNKKQKEKHGNKYDLSLDIYTSVKTKMKIKCNACGTIFEQTPDVHLRGSGCPNCYKQNKKLIHKSKITTKEIIKRFIEVHGDRYGYNNFIYINNKTKGIIDCEEHGSFEQLSNSHLAGSGCPRCKIISKGEKALIKIFKKHNIEAKPQFKFKEYKKLRYDFYLPELNILIEFHGGQHFKPIEFFGGIIGLKEVQKRDVFKKSLARDYNIPIIYFTYKHFRLPKEEFEKFVLMVISKVLQNRVIL